MWQECLQLDQGLHELMGVQPGPEPLLQPSQLTREVSWSCKDLVQPCRAPEYEDLLKIVFTGLKKKKS